MRRFLLTALLIALPALAQAAPLKVVASFSVLGDLVKQVGGDQVAVTTLVGPNGDTHTYEPKPSDAKAIGAADLLVVNGLGLEGWMDRLRQAAGYKGPVIVVSQQVKPLKSQEDGTDPHAWQSIPNALLYVTAIEAGLAKADPADAALFHQNAAAYRARLTALDGQVRAAFQPIPAARRLVITTHDAFGYYGHEYGITFLAPEGFSTESEASPKAVASLIGQIRRSGTHAVFIENMSDPRLINEIAQESGVDVTGQLYSDALSPPDGPAATYIDMLRWNTAALAKAMQ
jgi:zinc/manganese transport system substrate-binding protein